MQRKSFFFRSGMRVQGCDLHQVNIQSSPSPSFPILIVPALVGRNCTSGLKGLGMVQRNRIITFVWRVREWKSTSPALQLAFSEVSWPFSRRPRTWAVSLWLIPSWLYPSGLWCHGSARIPHIWRVHEVCQRMLAQFILLIATLYKAQLLKQSF
jgi:hypothetical protein